MAGVPVLLLRTRRGGKWRWFGRREYFALKGGAEKRKIHHLDSPIKPRVINDQVKSFKILYTFLPKCVAVKDLQPEGLRSIHLMVGCRKWANRWKNVRKSSSLFLF